MVHRLRIYLGFLGRYIAANLQGALEYRMSFVSQVLAMLFNDLIWLIFWLAYFSSFPLVAGWERTDIITMWAVVGCSVGVAATLFGGTFQIAGMVIRGELDFYLALPKPVLFHMMISRMDLTAPGDVLFGILVYWILVQPGPLQIALFILFTISGALIFSAFGVITQSLAFWLGNTEGLGQQLSNALITFSTYPTVIFQGAAKAILFTILPAGFIVYLPVRLLRTFSWPMFGSLALFTIVILILAELVFRAGLRRYESGNLVLMRD